MPNILTSDAISVFGLRSKIEKDVSASFETINLAETEQIGVYDDPLGSWDFDFSDL